MATTTLSKPKLMLNFLVQVAPPHSNAIDLSASPTKEMDFSIEIFTMQLMASVQVNQIKLLIMNFGKYSYISV
jgi:hypothetical protein